MGLSRRALIMGLSGSMHDKALRDASMMMARPRCALHSGTLYICCEAVNASHNTSSGPILERMGPVPELQGQSRQGQQ